MRIKSKRLALLSLLALVALFLGATVAFAQPTYTYTDYTNNYTVIPCNLTLEGSLDWLQCGAPNIGTLTSAATTSIFRKLPGTSPLIGIALTPATPNATTGWFPTSWTDGASPYGASYNQSNKFQSLTQIVYTVPVDPAGGTRVLKIWARNNSGTSGLTAQVGAGAPVTFYTAAGPTPFNNGGSNGGFYGLIRIFYSSSTPTDVMTVTMTGGGLQAAGVALSGLTAPAFVSNPLAMPSANVGAAYSQTLAGLATSAAGGALTYSKTAGPAWLSVAANGALTGTPAAGDVGVNVPYTVQVTDAQSGLSGTATMTITVNPAGSNVTKIAFVRDRFAGGYNLAAYKAFLENTVYPGRTMVYYDTPGRYINTNWDANKAELLDSDLIIFTNDLTTALYDWQQWQQLNVPMILHNQALSNNSNNQLGWTNGASTYLLRYGPNGYVNQPGNLGWMMMFNNVTGTAGVPRYYTPNTIDPFYAGLQTTPYPYGDNIANPTHNGPQYGSAGCNLGTTVNGDALTAGQWFQNSVWFQVFAGAKVIGATSNYDIGGGRVLGLPMDAADPLSNNWYNKGEGYNPSIVRWNQGDLQYRWNVPASSRRIIFPSGANQMVDEMTFLFDDPNGASLTPLGQTLLKNALLEMYDPQYGRRPVVSAGAATNVYFSGVETSHAYTIADATYNNGGDGAATGTYSWTVTAAVPADQGTVSITAGGTTLSPTITFTKPGTFTATLKAIKSANLDAVYSNKVITVVPAPPAIAKTWPSNGLGIDTLASMPTVITFNQPVAIATPPLMLTVNGTAVACTDSGDHMTFTCDAIALGATLPTTANTAVPFSLNTSGVTSLANGTAFAGATYTWNAMYNPAAHAAFRVRVFNGGNTSAAYQNPVNAILTSTFGPYAQIQWVPATTYSVAGGLLQATWDDFQAADLILAGASIGNNSLNAANGWAGGTGTNTAALLNTPVIMMRYNIWTWDAWASNTSAQWCTEEYRQFPWDALAPTGPMFAGVTLPTHVATIPAETVNTAWLQYPNVGTFDEMQSNTTAAPNSGTGQELADVNSYSTGRTAQYWPAGVPLWPASTVTHVARRGFWGMGQFNNWVYLNADGVKATQNFLKMMAPVPGAPTVVSTNPGAVVAGKLLSPSITFDHGVTSPGSLTITGIGTYSSPVASNENRTWTYTIPITDWIGKPSQTLNLSINMTGVTETESGLSMPFIGTTYAWTSVYNTANLTSIVFCTNKTTGIPNPYMTFLQSVYPGAAVTFMPQATYKANPWSATTLNTMQAASLVIMDGNDAAGTFANPQWNTLTTPLLSFSDVFLRDAGTGMESTSAAQYQYQGGAYNVNDTDPLLFGGVTIGYDGALIFDSVSGNMDLIEYGTAATPLQNGYTFIVHDSSSPHRPELQYWPPNTTFWQSGTTSSAGRRMYCGIDGSYGGDSCLANGQITANGLQLVRNVLRWMTAPVGQPVIVSTTPGATALKAVNTVMLTFDRHTSMPGTLTVKDGSNNTIATVSNPTAGIEGGIRWTYTLPAGTMLGKTAQTLTFSVAMTGVTETESGLQLPFAPSTYTWTSVYNPGNLENVVFVTNKTAGQTIYSTFIQSIYGPNTTVNMMPMSAVQTSKWMPWTASVMQTASLILVDSSNSMNGSGANNGLNNNQWNALTTPLISLTSAGPRTNAWMWATSTNNWGTNGLTVKNQDPILFNGVNVANLFVTTNTNGPLIQKLEYNPQTAPTYNGTDYAFYRAGNEQDVMLHYWPANTLFYTGATTSAAGPRMFFSGVAGGQDGDSDFATNTVTADGIKLFGNVMRFMSYPAGQPTIVSVSPTPSTLFTTSVPSIIVVTFDRPVAGPTNITINGATVSNPVGTIDNTVWTWTVPAALIPNIPTSVNVSLTKTGIYESGSGLQLPLGTGTYDWSFSFDKNQFHPTIAFVSNTDSSDDHSAYASFLVNDVYSTALYTRTIAIEDVRGKYYNMSPGTQSTAQALLNLVIVLPFQTEAQLATKTQWNNLTLPVLIHKAGTAVDWGLGNQPGNFGQWDTWDPIAWFGLGSAWPAGQGVANMYPPPASNDPIVNSGLHWVNNTVWYWGTTGPFQGIAVPNGLNSGVLSTTNPTVYTTWGWIGNTVQMVGMWERGAAFNGGGSAPARRVFQSMGAQVAADNYGSSEVANFFANAANPAPVFTGGAPQVLRNALRWMLNPDSFPFPLSVKSTGPTMGGSSGVVGAPITVVFSKPVSGVLPNDLTWNASSSAITYHATAATPQGAAPTDTWVFDGPWETNNALIGQFQPINMVLNGLDSSYHSHIMSPDGDGLPITSWTWYYAWTPVPASVSNKLWTLYE